MYNFETAFSELRCKEIKNIYFAYKTQKLYYEIIL